MADTPASDAWVRELALDPARSILLQAPAGSGKTTVLVLRFLTLLAVVDEPEEVLAITFTRKAAAEMRERVLGALQGTDRPDAGGVQWHALRTRVLMHAQQRGWARDELPLRLRIQTIDALNQYLATQRPAVDGDATSLQVTERARPLYERAARRTLRDAERDPSLREAIELLFDRLDNRWERAEQLLADLLERRAQWLPRILATAPQELPVRVVAALRSIVAEALQRGSACIPASLRAEAWAMAGAAARRRAADQHPRGRWSVWLSPPPALGADIAHLVHWQGLADLALTRQGMWRKPAGVGVRIGVPADEPAMRARFVELLARLERTPGALECLQTLRDLPPPHLPAEDAAALAGLSRVLRLAVAELQLEFNAARRVDYTLVAARAREALGEADAPSEFAMRFGSSMRHLLVDEFQDTSVEQFALIEALVEGWQTGDGRSLFLVGDPMQSIYQFRAAEVGLFLRAQLRGIGALSLQRLTLSRNFRSLPALTEWVNTHFARLLPEHDDLRSSAVRFLPSLAARVGAGAMDVGRVGVHALVTADAWQEADAVLQIVEAARARDPAASCAVLVANRRHALAIVARLRAAGMPVRGIDLEPLATRPAVRDLTSLTCALLRPADRTAWLAVLRAPWCGLSLADLAVLCDDDGKGLIPDLLIGLLADPTRCALLSAHGAGALHRCAPILLEAADGCGHIALASLVESTWLRLGGPAACTDAAAMRDAEDFLGALHAQQLEASPDEAAIGQLAESLFAQGQGDAAGRIEVLTIHRAKGLEWDVVILPGLGRRMRGEDAELLRWIELPRSDDGTDLLMTTLSLGKSGGADDVDPLSSYIGRLQSRRARNERLRLAYVAATRARCELHLLGHAPPSPASGQPAPPAGSLLQLLWPAVRAQFCAAATQPAAAAAGESQAALPVEPSLQRLPSDWRPPTLPAAVQMQGLPLPVEEAPAVPEYSWVGQTARAIGTVVHAELQALDWHAPPPTARERSAQQTRHDTALRQLGVAAAARPAALQRVAAALARIRADPRAAWIFAAEHRERCVELRLTGLVDGVLVDAVIDRTFVDAEGVRWVIDFKTSSHEGADVAAFLDREVQRHALPMRRYVWLSRLLGPQPVRAALYFPLLGAFRELA